MNFDKAPEIFDQAMDRAYLAVVQFETYAQLGIVVVAVFLALLLVRQLKVSLPILTTDAAEREERPLRRYAARFGNLLLPIFSILLLRISVELSQFLLQQDWLVYVSLTVNALLLFNAITDNFVASSVARRAIKWVGLPIVFMHYLNLPTVIEIDSRTSISGPSRLR